MIKISKALRQRAEEAKKTDAFWVERAKLQFAMALEGRLRSSKLNYRALAQKLGTSPAYVSKVFRGDSNMTIESMVKLARATGGQLVLTIGEAGCSVHDWDAPALARTVRFAGQANWPPTDLSSTITASTSVTSVWSPAENDASYALSA